MMLYVNQQNEKYYIKIPKPKAIIKLTLELNTIFSGLWVRFFRPKFTTKIYKPRLLQRARNCMWKAAGFGKIVMMFTCFMLYITSICMFENRVWIKNRP